MGQASGSFMLSGGVFKFGTGWGNNLKELFIDFFYEASRRSLPSTPAVRGCFAGAAKGVPNEEFLCL
jgi:hypothetical protein